MAQSPPSIFSDILRIKTGGQTLSGWTETRVTRSIERMPSDFEISLTERFPGSFTEAVVVPGSECTVSLGGDLVLTGFIDVYSPSYSANSHNVLIQGRSKCEDLVDSSYIPLDNAGWQFQDTKRPTENELSDFSRLWHDGCG
jgi:prophage tail gpP-like protein